VFSGASLDAVARAPGERKRRREGRPTALLLPFRSGKKKGEKGGERGEPKITAALTAYDLSRALKEEEKKSKASPRAPFCFLLSFLSEKKKKGEGRG